MVQMRILKIIKKNVQYTQITTFLLLDAQQQKVLVMSLNETMKAGPMRISSQQDAIVNEPLTIDFLANVLHSLGGTIEAIVLTVSGDVLCAQVHLRDQHGQNIVAARLNDALRLAEHEGCEIAASQEVLDLYAVNLADYGDGATPQEQIAAIAHLAESNPGALHPTLREPRNLDFSTGSRYWYFGRDVENASYALDPQVTYAGKASLAITLHQPFTTGKVDILSYESFLADHYRGQRLRLVAYVKVENIHQPLFELMVQGPIEEERGPILGLPMRSSRLTRSRITSPAEGSDWARHELVIDVPDDAHTIRFSLDTHEQGKIWLGGVHIETVDQSVPLTGTILRPPSRQPLNLDFSNGLEYWSIEESALWLYEYGIDTSVLPHPTSSAYLKATHAMPGDSCSLQQMVNMTEHKGQRVRFQAMLKAQDVEPQASLFIGSPFIGVKGDRIEKIIKGTTTWTSYMLIWQVPQDLYGAMSFGIVLHGKGQIWLKDVSIEVIV